MPILSVLLAVVLLEKERVPVTKKQNKKIQMSRRSVLDALLKAALPRAGTSNAAQVYTEHT